MKRIFAVIAVSGLIAATGPALALAASMPSDSTNWAASQRLTCSAFQKMDSTVKAQSLDSIRARMSDRANSLTNDKVGVASDVGLISQASMHDALTACSQHPARSVVTALRKYYNS